MQKKQQEMQKNVGSKFWDFAKKKVAQARNLPTNLRARTSGLLQKTAEKVITAIAPTKEKQMEAEQNIWAACNKMIKERKESDA